MSWDLIRSIQKTEDLRLILPFGLNLRPGDIVGVDDNGNLSLQSNCFALLGIPAGDLREGSASPDLDDQSGDDVTVAIRAAGEASSLFPNLPKGSAGVDISMKSSKSWKVVATGRHLSVLQDISRFTKPILQAADPDNRVWEPGWALITGVATVQKMTLLAAKSADTKVSLNFSGDLAPEQSPIKAKLTADVSIAAVSKSITQCIFNTPAPAFCTAVRVRKDWLGRSRVATAAPRPLPPENEFWEKLTPPGSSGATT
jgi:hypothetical protein